MERNFGRLRTFLRVPVVPFIWLMAAELNNISYSWLDKKKYGNDADIWEKCHTLEKSSV